MKPSKRTRVIAAVDENVLSQISASILRNQDYDLIAIHLHADLEKLGLNEEEFPSALHKSNFSRIESFCSGIDIPLRAIDVTEEVLAQVYDPFWTATLTGAPAAPTLDWVSGYLIPKLSSLARDYKAELISTGHLARKLEEKPGGILRYSDPAAHPSLDQSASFSRLHPRLGAELLSRLILPLGEVSVDRLVRLAREMGLLKKNADDFDGKLGLRKLLENHAGRGRWRFTESQLQNPNVQARAPGHFFKPGPVLSRENLTHSDHPGIPFFKVGDPAAGFPGQFVIEIRNSNRTLVLGPPSAVEVRRAFIQDLAWNLPPKAGVRDLKLQVEAFGDPRSSAGTLTLYPGNLGDLRLEPALTGLYAGKWLTFYDGTRVLGAGKVAETPRESSKQIPIEKGAESE